MLTGKSTSRIKIRRFFALIMVLVLILSGLLFYSAWNSLVTATRDQMQKDVEIFSVLINEEMKGAFHLLKVTEQKLAGKPIGSKGGGGSSALHSILRSCMEQTEPINSDEQSGQLLLIDPSGRLVAESVAPSPRRGNFSDDHFFRNLKDNPSKQYTVSNLCHALDTVKPVFQVAIPLRDSQNRLHGVLALQLHAQRIESQMKAILTNPKERMIIQMPDGKIVFQYPLFPLPDSSNPYLLDKSRLTPKESAQSGKPVLHRVGDGPVGISYAITLPQDPYGLSASVLIPERQILSLFFKQNSRLLLLTLITIVLIVLLFAGLSRQSGNLQKALLDSTTDFNTGLKNRRALEEELSRLVSQALRNNTPLSVLFIDIDHFKSFNDLNGHDLGDKVLRNVAQCIADSSRRPLDYCGRWGGEEFVMVLPETNDDEAVMVANELKNCVEKMEMKEMRLSPHEQITLSIGIATTKSCLNPTPESLIRLADQAMLRAKMEGRNRTVLSEGS